MVRMPRIARMVPMPTMVWKEKRTTLTGGRFAGRTASSPWTRAPGLWKASTESALGMRTPYRTCPCSYRPRTCSGAPLVVLARPSIAASLVGWSRLMAARGPVAGEELDRRGERGNHERHDDGRALVAGPAPA